MVIVKFVRDYGANAAGEERGFLSAERAEDLVKRGVAIKVRETADDGRGVANETPPTSKAIEAWRRANGFGPRPGDKGPVDAQKPASAASGRKG